MRLPRKSEARSYEVLHLSCKIILANLKISCSKKQPLSENLRPDLLTHLPRLLYCACHAKCIFPDPLQMSHAIVSETAIKNSDVLLTFCSLLTRCTIPCACHAKRHLNVQKCSVPHFFAFLTSKCASRHNGVHFFDSATSQCASRHNGVHFFDISTSKSGPTLECFVHFDLEMCFAPQRRALFHLSSDHKAPHPPL